MNKEESTQEKGVWELSQEERDKAKAENEELIRKAEQEKPPTEPIRLTKTEERLLTLLRNELRSMEDQALAIVRDLGGRLLFSTLEGFAAAHGVELGRRGHRFDYEAMGFVPFNEPPKAVKRTIPQGTP
jgi:hypothetical protein